MDIKYCGNCKLEKKFEDFGKCKHGKFGLNSHCKKCRKEYDIKNREKFLEYHKIKRQKEIEKFKEYDKKYKAANKYKIRDYNKKRWKCNIQHRIKSILRVRLHTLLKGDNKFKSAYKLIGCDIIEFRHYMESKFLPEMNWDNHGNVWELDHILPCSKFDLTLLEEQQKCFHFSNYQPLFKTTQIAESFGYTDQIGNRNKSNK